MATEHIVYYICNDIENELRDELANSKFEIIPVSVSVKSKLEKLPELLSGKIENPPLHPSLLGVFELANEYSKSQNRKEITAMDFLIAQCKMEEEEGDALVLLGGLNHKELENVYYNIESY